MSFVYIVVAKMGDAEGFGTAADEWAADRFMEMGAVSSTATEVIMGGEMAGSVFVSFETATADAAMDLQSKIYADDKMVALMRDTQVQVLRRGLMRVQADFGVREGAYSSALYLGGGMVDDATALANFSHNWSHLQEGANGLTAMQVVAQGPAPFTGAVATWADSIDALLAASAKNFADPKVHEMMATSGTTVLGRVLGRRLY